MKKEEIIKEDYQQLFKTMLGRTGKDINSMSDEQKKKFFTAVDKAYKAKSEGRLIDSKKNQLNEDFFNPFILPILYHVVPILITFGIAKLGMFIFRKDYAKAVVSVLKELLNNSEFTKKAAEIIANRKEIDNDTALEIFTTTPIAKKTIRKYADSKNLPDGTKQISSLGIEDELANVFQKAWNTPSVKNTIVNTVIKKIKS
jgi:hypothetical protein